VAARSDLKAGPRLESAGAAREASGSLGAPSTISTLRLTLPIDAPPRERVAVTV
jgi:hypothetical protein